MRSNWTIPTNNFELLIGGMKQVKRASTAVTAIRQVNKKKTKIGLLHHKTESIEICPILF